MTQRNPVFDIMKGIGILLVLIGHLPGLLPGLKTFIYSFHMPLFFLLAGYFSKDLGDGEVLKQIGKDAKRLLLPFVFTQLLLLVWTAVQWLFKHNSDMFVRALLSMLWGGADVINSRWGQIYVCHIWFLPALFWGKMVHNLLKKKFSDNVCLFLCLIISFLSILLEKGICLPWCVLQGLSSLTFIGIGSWYANHRLSDFGVAAIICCWILSLFWGGMDMYGCSYKCYPLDVLGACGGTLCIYWISKQIAKLDSLTKPLIWCGKYSLVILCFHTFEWLSAIAYSLVIHSPFQIEGNAMLAFRYALVFVMAWLATEIPVVRDIYGVKKS